MKKQLTKILSLIILAMLATSALTQQCALSSSASDLLQAGSFELTNGHSSASLSRQHKFTFNLNFQVPAGRSLQVAASPAAFPVSPSSGVDFSVWGGAGTSAGTGLVVLLLDEDNTWTKVKISYLASARADFFIGTFAAATYFPQSTSNGVVSIGHGVPNWTPSQQTFVSIVELAGAKTAATTFSISLTKVTFDKASGVMTVETSLSSTPAFEFVVITYVIFNSAIPLTYSPYSVGPTPTYIFSGIDELTSASNPVIASFGFTSSAAGNGLTCIGANCPSPCISSQNCVALGGTVTLTKQCALCASGKVFSNGQCVSQASCGPNQYFDGQKCLCNPNYLMVNGVCYMTCGPNAVVMNSMCQCIPGYTYSSTENKCVEPPQCGPNFTLVNGNCVCKEPFGLINGACTSCVPNSHRTVTGYCVCDTGYQFDASFKCVIKCPPHSHLNSQGQCQCDQGYYLSSNACIEIPTCTNGQVFNGQECACPQGQIVHAHTSQCTACTGAGETVFNGKCDCKSTYFPTSQGCKPCPDHSHYSTADQACQCDQGYYASNNQCVVIPTCTNGQVFNGQECACPQGQIVHAHTNQCTACTGAGETVVNGKCDCKSTYFPTSQGCKPCPDHSHYSAADQACQCDQGYSVSNGECVPNCPDHSTWNGNACACDQGYHFNSGGQCIECPANEEWDGSACVCKQGYYRIQGSCQQCPANTQWNGSSCQCKNGFYLVNGKCQQCPADSTYDQSQGGCICNEGFFSDNKGCTQCHSSCSTCSGSTASDCLTCPSGIPNNGRCNKLCLPGQFLNAQGNCAPCLSHCMLCYTASTCTTCEPGYTANSVNNVGTIITSCEKNPSDTTSTITLRGNVLGNKVIYQGMAMSLMPTKILASNCGICNELFRIDVNSQFSGITTTQVYINQTQYWFVIEFRFPTASFVPTFEYTVRINPIHATYFTAQDMAQVLRGAFNQESFVTSTPFIEKAAGDNANIPTPPTQRSGPLGGSASSAGVPASNGLSTELLSEIFSS